VFSKTYKDIPGSVSFGFVACFVSFTVIGGLYYISFIKGEFFRQYNKGGFEFVVLLIFLFLGAYSVYIFIAGLTEPFLSSWKVECGEEALTGWAKYGQRTWTMKYSDIAKIYPCGAIKPWFVRASVVIKNFNGEFMCVTVNIEHFAEFMEFIKEKAVNAKKVDFGNWPQNGRVWKY
jgi:hypothetical protein